MVLGRIVRRLPSAAQEFRGCCRRPAADCEPAEDPRRGCRPGQEKGNHAGTRKPRLTAASYRSADPCQPLLPRVRARPLEAFDARWDWLAPRCPAAVALHGWGLSPGSSCHPGSRLQSGRKPRRPDAHRLGKAPSRCTCTKGYVERDRCPRYPPFLNPGLSPGLEADRVLFQAEEVWAARSKSPHLPGHARNRAGLKSAPDRVSGFRGKAPRTVRPKGSAQRQRLAPCAGASGLRIGREGPKPAAELLVVCSDAEAQCAALWGPGGQRASRIGRSRGGVGGPAGRAAQLKRSPGGIEATRRGRPVRNAWSESGCPAPRRSRYRSWFE